MCKVAHYSYASVVTVSIPDSVTCRSPSWISVNSMIIAYWTIFFVNISSALLFGTIITVRDTRILYGYKPSNNVWRLIRLTIMTNVVLYLVTIIMEIYYRSTTLAPNLPSLEILTYVGAHVSMAACLCLVTYFAISNIRDVNDKLDSIRDGVEHTLLSDE